MSLRADSMEAANEALGSALTESIDPAGGLAIVFATSHHARRMAEVIAHIRRRTLVRTLFGGTGAGVIGPAGEVEQKPALAVLLAASDRLTCGAALLPRLEPDEAVALLKQELPSLHRERGVLVMLLEPKSLNPMFLPKLAAVFPETPVVGAAAAWCTGDTEALLFVDGESSTTGLAALHLAGCVDAAIGVSQVVTPETTPREITEAFENVIARVESEPAADVIGDFVQSHQQETKESFEIFCALADSAEDFDQGRYVVRNILGVEPDTKRVSVGDFVRPGQFISFGVRSAKSARRNFRRMLERLNSTLTARVPRAALLFNCCARGQSLYGRPNVDLDALREFYPDLPLIGMFGFAEIGPIAWAGRRVRSTILNHTSAVLVLSEPLEALGTT